METQGSANGQAVTLIRRSSKQISVKKLLIHKMNQEKSLVQEPLSPEFLAHEESHGYNEHTKCIQRLVTKASEMGNGLGSLG